MTPALADELQKLIEEGRAFTFDNFSYKDQYGFPSVMRAEYISWRTRLDVVLLEAFGPSGPVYLQYKQYKLTALIGNGLDSFVANMEGIVGCLLAAHVLLARSPSTTKEAQHSPRNNRVFIVHGHDDQLKQEAELFLKEIGLDAVVLHRQPDGGRTLIEKLEQEGDVDYAIVFLTPDDVAFAAEKASIPETERQLEPRARQNVILELGYFIGRLGRGRVCAIHKLSVIVPSDILGVVYKPVRDRLDEVKYDLIRELRHAGFQLSV